MWEIYRCDVVACRTTWSETWIQKHQGCGVYANLPQELQYDNQESFRDVNAFEEVLRMVVLFISKDTVMRASICPEERILATGMLYVKMHKVLDFLNIQSLL